MNILSPFARSPFEPIVPLLLPDINEANRFLIHMVADGQLTLQTFDDSNQKRGYLAKSFENSSSAMNVLSEMNLEGAGCFWTVNQCNGTGRREEKNVVAVRFLFADLDGAPLQPVIDTGATPTALVESSPNRFHVYWRVTNCSLNQFKKLQKAISRRFNSDNKVHDLPRVMRLPGFYHQKHEPYMTRIIELNDCQYTVDEIVTGLGLDLESDKETYSNQNENSASDYFAPIAEGGRNDKLFKDGCKLRKAGFSDTELKNLMLAINSRFSPPMEESEVLQIFASVLKYDQCISVKPRNLVLVNYSEIVSRDIPKCEPILPWLTHQSLSMLYAWRGIGKTWVSLGIAVAIATGGKFLKWQVQKPCKVLYLDGEMPAYAIQERLKLLTPNGFPYPEKLQILTPDFQPDGMPDLATSEGQTEIDTLIAEDTTVIIVDNISALCRSGKENEAEGWIPVQTWALKQRAAGRSVLFIHHAGKAGAQRGSSKREDLLDTVMMLKRPGGYTADQGAVFEVHFEKARHLSGEETIPFVAKLECNNGKATWTMLDIENATFDKVIELFKLGLRQGEIATELGVNKSTVSRNVQKATAAGLLPKK